MTDKKYYWLYTLRLKNGKYYVGRTSNKDPQVRIKQHEKGFYSAQWVKIHGFFEALEIIAYLALQGTMLIWIEKTEIH